MSTVEETGHIEMAAGEGKEEVAQLNGSGAVLRFPCSLRWQHDVNVFFCSLSIDQTQR